MKNLIIDLDGTLVDTRPGILFSLQQAVKQTDPDREVAWGEFIIGPPVREMFRLALNIADDKELDTLEAAFRSSYDAVGWEMCTAYPGVSETLDQFQKAGFQLFIATYKPSSVTNKILTRLGLVHYFREVVCPDIRQTRFNEKADEIRYLLDSHDLERENTIYIGDTCQDQAAAQACGIEFIAAENGNGEFCASKGEVHRVGTFSDLRFRFSQPFQRSILPAQRMGPMINRNVFEELFVLELANNHWGDIQRGLRIIKEFGTVVRYNDVRAAIKLQIRDVDTFIHKDFRKREDIRYIKKTLDTRLGREELAALAEAIRRADCVRMATPFDEKSVDMCMEIGIEILKVGSSDVTDWPLLEKIAKTHKPVMVSTGGTSLKDIDNMVLFFENRNIPLAINHCVSIYPSEDAELQLNQIDFLINRYPGHVIGFSTHEYKDWVSSILIAYAKGARTFERHIDIKTPDRPFSPYCSTPEQIAEWFQAFHKAKEMCGAAGTEKIVPPQKEIDYLTSLVRGVYVKRDLPAGHLLSPEDYYLAIPLQKGQLSCRELLNDQVLAKACKKDAPLMVDMVDSLYNHDETLKKQLYQRGL